MQYPVCYDIADDRRRQRLSELLLDFGTRVQESVFQCRIDAVLAEKMMARVRHTIEEHTDKVPCANPAASVSYRRGHTSERSGIPDRVMRCCDSTGHEPSPPAFRFSA